MAKKLLGLGSDGKLNLRLSDGRIAPIDKFAINPQTALLLVDTSSSMDGENMNQAKSGAIKFATDALIKNYRVGLIRFASSATWACNPTLNRSEIVSCINSLHADGSTNMTDAIQLAINALHQKSTLRAIILITDGRADDPISALHIAQQAKNEGIDIIAIGTDGSDKGFLDKLASRPDLIIKVDRKELGQSIASAAKLLR